MLSIMLGTKYEVLWNNLKYMFLQPCPCQQEDPK